MIKDSEKGIFEVVIVHMLDRFARDRYDSTHYKRKLRENGVKVASVFEQLDDSPESIILESVLEGMAEYYLKNLTREARKGMRKNAKRAFIRAEEVRKNKSGKHKARISYLLSGKLSVDNMVGSTLATLIETPKAKTII